MRKEPKYTLTVNEIRKSQGYNKENVGGLWKRRAGRKKTLTGNGQEEQSLLGAGSTPESAKAP